MNRTVLDLWVGFFVLTGIGALLFLALKVGNLGAHDASNTYQLKAKFANIGGLKVRAPVKSAGVVVGRVTAVQFDQQDYTAQVTMNVDASIKFSRDTTASILTSGLLGEQYVGLTVGGDTEFLKNGDTMRLTQSAVVLENLIGQFIFGKAAEGQQEK